MLTNIKAKIFSLLNTTPVNFMKNDKAQIELEISWDDLSKESILKSALQRNGIYGYVTEKFLVLEDGSIYTPSELSDHWEAYINSKKFKPKIIVYNITNG
jgi:hypothetical protein